MDAIDLYVNKDKLVTKFLEDFVKNYTGDNPKAIKALSDKIQHMCFNIGCPISVKPMLNSICKMQVKKWAADNDWGKDYSRGRQLTRISAWELDKYYQVKKNHHNNSNDLSKAGTHLIDTGHFRWDWTAYMITRDDADYIMKYFFNKERKGKTYLREITN